MSASQELNRQGLERSGVPWRANEQEKWCDNLKTETQPPTDSRGCEVCAKPGEASCRVADDDQNTMGTNHAASLMCWGNFGLEDGNRSVKHSNSKTVEKTCDQKHSLAKDC